jgi:hypothetical protein
MLFVARNPARSDCYESKQGWAGKYSTAMAVPRKCESASGDDK